MWGRAATEPERSSSGPPDECCRTITPFSTLGKDVLDDFFLGKAPPIQ